jgi:DNA-binding transcriptional ArsR family regulator
MSVPDAERPLEEAALLHEGLAHPARVAVLRELRAAKRLPLAELRRRVSAAWRAVDTRTLHDHVQKMHVAGIVDLRREQGQDVAVLVRDVALRVKPA